MQHFLDGCSVARSRASRGSRAAALERIVEHDWPGNVRELENLVERLVVLRRDGVLDVSDLPAQFRRGPHDAAVPNLGPGGVDFNDVIDRVETKLILQALDKTGWNKNQAARLLGLNRTTLIEKIKKKGLESQAPAGDPAAPAPFGVQ